MAMQKSDFKIMCIPKRMDNVRRTMKSLHLSLSDIYVDCAMLGNPRLSSLELLRKPFDLDITHRCLLQDDIELVPRFADFVDYLVNLYPKVIWVLYAASKSKLHKYPAIMETQRVYGPGIIIPACYIDDIISCEKNVRDDYIHDDGFYEWFARKKKIPIYTVLPNVVNITGSKSEFRHAFSTKDSLFSGKDPFYYDYKFVDDEIFNKRAIESDNKILKKIEYVR